MPDQFIVGIDIGSSRLCIAVAVRESGGAVRYIGHSSVPSAGIRGGDVSDPEALAGALTRAAEEGRSLIGMPVSDVVVTMSGLALEAVDRSGGVALALSGPIRPEDVTRAIETTRGSDPAGLHSLHRVVRALVLDGVRTDDPTGKVGSRLDVRVRDWAAPVTLVERLRRAADRANLRIHTLVPAGVASAAAATSEAERESGVAVIDIGRTTTDIGVYAGGELRHLASIRAGAAHVASDIASMLDIDPERGDALLRRYGAMGDDPQEELITEWTPRVVATLQRQALQDEFSAAAIHSIAGARVIQIGDRVREVLAQTEAVGQLRAGVMLTGEGSAIGGIADIFSAILRQQVRQRAVIASDGFPASADPGAAASIGLVRYCLAVAQPAEPAPRRRSGSGSASGATSGLAAGIVHPSFMRQLSRDVRDGHDTIDVTSPGSPRRTPQRDWGHAFRGWLREFIPARADD